MRERLDSPPTPNNRNSGFPGSTNQAHGIETVTGDQEFPDFKINLGIL